MKQKVLKIHPADNVLVALDDLKKGETVSYGNDDVLLADDVNAKHKFVINDMAQGDTIKMYGLKVGETLQMLPKGSLISTTNVQHAINGFAVRQTDKKQWQAPDVSRWKDATFLGYHRPDGSVGVANYWLVIPLVFCETRNVLVLKEALTKELGYEPFQEYRIQSCKLVKAYLSGSTPEELLATELDFSEPDGIEKSRIFPNVDGIKFLTHDLGCGGTKEDARNLCGLLAGYITHPNVAGATVLSLGCQNAQISMLEEEIAKRDAVFSKPFYTFEQQRWGTEKALISAAIKQTFVGLAKANEHTRKPSSLNKLVIGLECGGSDGFSGISANPAIGYTSDIAVALGGTVILSEFPELCGTEQELSDRCVDEATATRFISLMRSYAARAEAVGSDFDSNPSAGNIRDGLITDAIKSAGAAKKGGTSPIVHVADYPEKITKPGLNLLCTPGNDVESTTAEVGSGATIVLFTTGLGTPTGNPVAPVIKISTNTKLYKRMPDIIDIDAGAIIEGNATIEEVGESVFDFTIAVANGFVQPKAVLKQQDDFIPWKRGISL